VANRPVKIQFTQEGLDKVEGALAGVNSKLDATDAKVRGPRRRRLYREYAAEQHPKRTSKD
jgi:hypothetical protein